MTRFFERLKPRNIVQSLSGRGRREVVNSQPPAIPSPTEPTNLTSPQLVIGPPQPTINHTPTHTTHLPAGAQRKDLTPPTPARLALNSAKPNVQAAARRWAAELGNRFGVDPEQILDSVHPIILATTTGNDMNRMAKDVGLMGGKMSSADQVRSHLLSAQAASGKHKRRIR